MSRLSGHFFFFSLHSLPRLFGLGQNDFFPESPTLLASTPYTKAKRNRNCPAPRTQSSTTKIFHDDLYDMNDKHKSGTSREKQARDQDPEIAFALPW